MCGKQSARAEANVQLLASLFKSSMLPGLCYVKGGIESAGGYLYVTGCRGPCGYVREDLDLLRPNPALHCWRLRESCGFQSRVVAINGKWITFSQESRLERLHFHTL
jgi:hypothetical protein